MKNLEQKKEIKQPGSKFAECSPISCDEVPDCWHPIMLCNIR